MDVITDTDVSHAMSTYGGSFARALAVAWLMADEQNRTRIQAAFPELWTTYHELVTLKRQREAKA